MSKATPEKPNIIYILADDLGYGEIGVFGQQKIETPNIDALAKAGMIFTQHYTSAPVCAPARYMFLTGKHAGHAFIRGNDEWNERGDVWNYYAMAKDSSLEGQRPVPKGTKTLADNFKKAGYTTALVGKWGLGAPHTKSIPNEMGFDFFYGFNGRHIPITRCICTRIGIGCTWPTIPFRQTCLFLKARTPMTQKAMKGFHWWIMPRI